jgi:hypothetical protein
MAEIRGGCGAPDILIKLGGIEADIKALDTKIETNQHINEIYQKQVKSLVFKHERTLDGDGTEDMPGLRIDVRALKNIETNRKWTIRTLGAAVIGGTLKILRDIIYG